MGGEPGKRQVRVKVCGFTDPEQLRQSAALGIDMAGIILWEGSKRAVNDEDAASFSAVARECGIDLVGVFVDEVPDQVERCYSDMGLAVAQLHGSESAEQVRALCDRGLRIWKGLQMSPGFRNDDARTYWEAGAEAVLLDAWHPHLRGGTGQEVDWQVAARLAAQGRLVLAGGLSGDNVENAVRMIRPWAVDASSSLELSPGHKDITRVGEFVRAAQLGVQQEDQRT